MGIYDYLMLTDNEQWQLIWAKSSFITNYKSIDRKFQLRALDKLFIELELNVFTDAIIAKKVFVHGPRLDKYVKVLGYTDWKSNQN